jgi:hypothetical protein
MASGMGDLSAKDRMKVVEEKGESAVYLDTETIKTKVVVSCAGGLVEPRGFPEHIQGSETFKGKIFHSARWDETVDFKGKDVVVVGTGCSSAQIVPSLPNAPYNAKSVTQLMRSPPWVSYLSYKLYFFNNSAIGCTEQPSSWWRGVVGRERSQVDETDSRIKTVSPFLGVCKHRRPVPQIISQYTIRTEAQEDLRRQGSGTYEEDCAGKIP